MPPKKTSDGDLLDMADRCDGNAHEIARRLGVASYSNIARRLRRLNWQPRDTRTAATHVQQPDDKALLASAFGQIYRVLSHQRPDWDIDDPVRLAISDAHHAIYEALGYVVPGLYVDDDGNEYWVNDDGTEDPA